MQEKVVQKEAMPDFLQRLIGTAKTIAPVRQPSGHYLLKPVARADEVALDFPFLYYSAKEYLLPPGEPVLQFGRREGKPFVTPETDTEEVILFGLHPCDLNAVWTCEAFFTADNKDDNFLARRRHMTIVGLDCAKPCDEYAFCADMKTDVAQGGYDVLLTDIGDAYFARAATERGEKLLAHAPAATAKQRAALADLAKARPKQFPKRIEFDTDELPKRLEGSYDSLVWTAVAKRCYSCGSCVLVCPTCFCFDLKDRLSLNLADGQRERWWDGCMLNAFAQVSGGENFRREKHERLRHRMFRKGKYIKEQIGRFGCVGCGRCDRACTSKISIVATYNQLKGGA
ncbi:MAG: 4Fe-4S dicluster domain-containing protein [Candidatus Brocadiia bacterium]